MDATRRGFIRGRFRAARTEIRPPWAVAPGEFDLRCTRCDDCVSACPTRVIQRGEGGFPAIDFSAGECTFCGDCVTACSTGALQRAAEASPWSLIAVLGEACVTRQGVECRICGEVCEARAIRFRPTLGGIAQPQLDVTACTGCGACVAPCPVGAIGVDHSMEIEQ